MIDLIQSLAFLLLTVGVHLMGKKIERKIDARTKSVGWEDWKGAMNTVRFIAGEDLKRDDVVTLGKDGLLYRR